MIKLLSWSVLFNPKVWLSVFGILQVAIKFLKELLCLIVNILFPVIPDGKFEQVILKIRDWVNKIDGWIEKIKDKIK